MKKLPFLFGSTTEGAWPWPACGSNPKTLSFRASSNDDDTTKSACVENSAIRVSETAPESKSFSMEPEDCCCWSSGESSIEMVISGLNSNRLFFEPGETRSILEPSRINDDDKLPFKESAVILVMESSDPLLDFRRSMGEMVAAHGLNYDWDCLEELLTWYLKVNFKSNHGYIVGAFVDLLVDLNFVNSSPDNLDYHLIDDDDDDDDNNNPSYSSTTTAARSHSFISPLSFSSSSSASTSPSIIFV